MPIRPDDIALNKAAIVERALRPMRQECQANPQLDNYTNIDAMTLNVERACQAGIDLAMHIVAQQRLGMPQFSTEAFELIYQAGYINKELLKDMIAMRALEISPSMNISRRICPFCDTSPRHDGSPWSLTAGPWASE